MSRPPIAPQLKRSCAIRVRLLPVHNRLIRKAAAQVGLGISDWLRERMITAAQAELDRAANPG